MQKPLLAFEQVLIERVKKGKPFLVFGDSTLTACKPIGGPGKAITSRQQGEHLFALLGRAPCFKQVPVGLLDAIIDVLGTVRRVVPALAAKAELARIGRYYATESMLVLDPQTGLYDAAATPSTGTDTLFDFYARLVSGDVAPERGDHAVF